MNIEEFLYPAMEDFKVDFVVDKGMFAKTINVPLKKFTLIGATTRAGSLSAPLRNRFGLFYHLEFYAVEELRQIIMRSARILEAQIDEAGASGGGSPGARNPAHRQPAAAPGARLRGSQSHRHHNSPGGSRRPEARRGGRRGLDDLDRSFLSTIIRVYHGGPVGVEALSATLNEEVDTLVDMVEPFLLQQGFISRTKAGRKANEPAYKHLKLKPPAGVPPSLFG